MRSNRVPGPGGCRRLTNALSSGAVTRPRAVQLNPGVGCSPQFSDSPTSFRSRLELRIGPTWTIRHRLTGHGRFGDTASPNFGSNQQCLNQQPPSLRSLFGVQSARTSAPFGTSLVVPDSQPACLQKPVQNIVQSTQQCSIGTVTHSCADVMLAFRDCQSNIRRPLDSDGTLSGSQLRRSATPVAAWPSTESLTWPALWLVESMTLGGFPLLRHLDSRQLPITPRCDCHCLSRLS
jgi:hypothetical protein